jgi:hypothetical protein
MLWARVFAIGTMSITTVFLVWPIAAAVISGVDLPPSCEWGAGVVLTLGIASIFLFLRLLRPDESIPTTFDDRIAKLRSNLESSSDLIREINAEFDLQVAAAEKIKAEAEQNHQLAQLNAEQAKAVKNLRLSWLQRSSSAARSSPSRSACCSCSSSISRAARTTWKWPPRHSTRFVTWV